MVLVDERNCNFSYDLDLGKAVELIRERAAKRVGLQAPEGLKRAMPSMAKEIAYQTGAEVIISGDPCYGACDVDLSLGEEVDLLFHLGHAELGDHPEKVIFLEVMMKEDLGEVVKRLRPSKVFSFASTLMTVSWVTSSANGVNRDPVPAATLRRHMAGWH